MDDKEGFLLIGVSMIILLALVLSIFAVMLIYRKRKVEHAREVKTMNESFSKEILATQLEIQQQTMQHIGREIHDNVGQKLTLAVLYLQQLDAENKNTTSQKKITTINSIINESLNDLRSLSKNLTDTNNLQTDLYDLINTECVNVNAIGSCAVQLQSITKYIEVSQGVKNFVLRILQEFLQNSLKHSGCTEIKVQLWKEQKGLMICAFDNGKGFINNDASNNGIGLKNMKKRAEIIEAELTIESAPGAGTKMNLFIPASKFSI